MLHYGRRTHNNRAVFFYGLEGVIMGSIMGSQNIIGSDYRGNISVVLLFLLCYFTVLPWRYRMLNCLAACLLMLCGAAASSSYLPSQAVTGTCGNSCCSEKWIGHLTVHCVVIVPSWSARDCGLYVMSYHALLSSLKKLTWFRSVTSCLFLLILISAVSTFILSKVSLHFFSKGNNPQEYIFYVFFYSRTR